MAEVEPETEIEARLAKRMAIAFWKSERAEQIEVALFDAAPKLRPPQAGFEWENADPLTTFDLKRFDAVRGYQAQQGRELSPLPQGAAAVPPRRRSRNASSRLTRPRTPVSRRYRRIRHARNPLAGRTARRIGGKR